MAFRGVVWAAAVVVVAAGAYGAYAPASVDAFAPAVGPWAHRLHDIAFAPQTRSDASSPPVVGGSAHGPAAIQVSVATVKRVDFPVKIEGLGQIQAYNNVTIRARVDGQIMKIGFREGDEVKAGDLIAEIDPRPFQASLDQAAAKKGQDEANVANAKLDQQRYSTLAKQNFASQQQLDTQNALVAQLTAQIAADEATVHAAKVQLDYTSLRSPISGRVGLRLIDEGNLVSGSQQTAIVTIAQLQPIAAVFTLPETQVANVNRALAAGQLPVTVTDSDGHALATGKLLTADNQVDAASGTIKLKAEFPNQDHALWPGLAVTASVTVGADKDALVVPAIAVQHGEKGLYVYVVDEGSHAALRNVKVSHQTPDLMVLTAGVKEGDRVITTGQFLLQPGTPVQVDAASTGS